MRGPSDPRVVTPVFSEELISRATSSAVGVTIQVRLTVACEASDLDDIGVKLRKLIADIGASGEEEAG